MRRDGTQRTETVGREVLHSYSCGRAGQSGRHQASDRYSQCRIKLDCHIRLHVRRKVGARIDKKKYGRECCSIDSRDDAVTRGGCKAALHIACRQRDEIVKDAECIRWSTQSEHDPGVRRDSCESVREGVWKVNCNSACPGSLGMPWTLDGRLRARSIMSCYTSGVPSHDRTQFHRPGEQLERAGR